jgi:adenylate cyclase
MSVQRRLAAILAADVVGYSRLMEQDETGTLAVLAERRKAILEPLFAKHRGRVVRLMGDGTLAEFASAVDAVQCAVDIQKATKQANAALPEDRTIVLRVGLNLGDVVVEGDDLYGDGVNIAARLEAMAEPGGICLSAAIHQQVERLLPFAFTDLGDRALKNISRPVRVYCLADEDGSAGVLPTGGAIGRTSTRAKPSIAILPFVNMSGDPEQEYFSDGITEDIITDLSKVSTLSVLSRNTAFTFKGKAVDIGQVAQRLKVSHVVEGSVRKVGGRVRVTAQLIDASKDNHVWGERYDRDLNDIFALQDELAHAIVAALKVRLLPTEKKAIENRSTRNPAAYQYYLQGRYHYLHFGVKNLEIAIRFAQRALEIDPQYARAWVLIAVSQSTLRIRGRSDESGLAAAERALAVDPTLAEAHSARGRVLAELGRHDEAIAELEESVRLDPDSPEVRFNFGQTCFASGRYEAAVEHLERAAALGEESFDALTYLAQIYQALGREGEAKDAARQALAQIERRIALYPDDALSLSWGAGLLAQLGHKERAEEWISRALIVEPDDAVIHFNVACGLAQMSETDRALDLLESAAHKMPAFAVVNWIKNDGELAPLRGHPRYQALAAREEARLAATEPKQANEPAEGSRHSG